MRASQQPVYKDSAKLQQVLEQLSDLPPLVTSWEIEALRGHIAKAQQGEAFVLQGGDCAETFADCRSDKIAQKLKILLQMSLVLLYGLQKPVIRIGRMAGQYAKPRSADSETREGVSLPSFRGDLVNRGDFTEADREPDPELMLRGYERAALTLNFVRSLIDGGFADLHHPENWDLDWVQHSPLADEYHQITQAIANSLDFFEVVSGGQVHATRRVEFYTSHEGLQLPYEEAQTRFLEHRNAWYNLSTHFPWIGMRTAQLDDAHVEYFRGIRNPMGIKLGPGITADWLLGLLERLNPKNEPGRMTLIHRFGAGKVETGLPELIRTVQKAGARVLWMCDPMHGNTESASNGRKTRRFDNILSELETAFRIHKDMGTYLGGVHFEMTGENVTECTGGARGLTDADLDRAYHTQVDPRLNYEQAMEMAMRIAGRRR
jgi:3-deoxy-7-phosphoheptulonate synthase